MYENKEPNIGFSPERLLAERTLAITILHLLIEIYEEIDSLGGFENMGPRTIEIYEDLINIYINEIDRIIEK